ncbi:Bin/amphiphysin/Rvs domain for vesicular trafficking-domain-containing protein [Endogone sp. FLAS-F59071]|nr:Bin/amphiphysin/Rvs domain for vesicular trafficking-domain-containing protein [Endogone sp. FLAS-F59071]|eukprot:RUS20449.1 Bin/amphiphysin/Rvs domain for vesicular trafficking-domain-containing protein [Endogone sp. FLAS-F59071]
MSQNIDHPVQPENTAPVPTTPSLGAVPSTIPIPDPNVLLQNANQIANATMDQLANFGSRLNPFAQRLGKGFGQVRQYAQERLGTAEDVTELPQEYKDLEKRVDALRAVHQNLLRITRTFSTQTYDYPVQLQESLFDTARSVGDRLQTLTLSPAEREAEAAAQAAAQSTQPPAPKTLAHALSRAAAQSAELIGIEEPLGAALFKYATVQEKIGDSRLRMDQEITNKFVQPFQTTLRNNIEFSMKARRNVQSARLTLDASKARYRAARPEKSEAARLEVEQAEDQFVAAVEEATTLMKSVLETVGFAKGHPALRENYVLGVYRNFISTYARFGIVSSSVVTSLGRPEGRVTYTHPSSFLIYPFSNNQPEPLRNLADLIAAQVNYFKEAHEILADLAPEIDEMQVTQEALYRNSRAD